MSYNIELLYEQTIPFLRIYLGEMKSHVHIKTHTQMFIPILFIISKNGHNVDVYQLMNGKIIHGIGMQWNITQP